MNKLPWYEQGKWWCLLAAIFMAIAGMLENVGFVMGGMILVFVGFGLMLRNDR